MQAVQSATAHEAIDLEIRVTTPWGSSGRQLRFALSSPSGVAGFHHERLEGPVLHSPDQFQQRLLEQLDGLDRRVDAGGRAVPAAAMLAELEGIGHDLYQQLFPRSMRAAYREVAGRVRSLLLTSDEPWIPWELVRPCEEEDDDFLCMRFAMSRWLSGDVPPCTNKQVRRMLLVEAGGPGLEAASEESRFLQRLAQGTEGLEDALSRCPSWQEAVDLLGSGRYDLIHLTGHGGHDLDRPAEAEIRLADRSLRARHLPPAAEKVLRERRPVVLFNSCEVGRLSSSLTAVDGWAERWVRRCGCAAFLAPTWSVDDTRAARFAGLVYGDLLSGRTLGEAVLAARHTLRREEPEDLSWLAYTLYGAPHARIGFGNLEEGAEPETSSKPITLVSPLPPTPPSDVHRRRATVGSLPGSPAVASAAGGRTVVSKSLPVRVLGGAATVLALVVVFAMSEFGPSTAAQDPQVLAALEGLESGGASDGGGSAEMEVPPSPPPAPFPLEKTVSGRIGIIVLDQAGNSDGAVARAVRAALASSSSNLSPILPQVDSNVAQRLLAGEPSLFPGDGRAPWGAEYLLLASATQKALPQRGVLEAYSLTLDSQLVSGSDGSTVAWSHETHNGTANNSAGALAQAAERCLSPITNTLQGG